MRRICNAKEVDENSHRNRGVHQTHKDHGPMAIDDYQTHHRLREATGRKRAEELNERVMIWSLGQSAVVVFIGIGQVFLLKSFFNDKRTRY
uniref:GOLD domain-containing protein n=1 Tax=Caenorhabditis japonica TaxID=281687 RepID=A0A8R1EFN9_CAEJA